METRGGSVFFLHSTGSDAGPVVDLGAEYLPVRKNETRTQAFKMTECEKYPNVQSAFVFSPVDL